MGPGFARQGDVSGDGVGLALCGDALHAETGGEGACVHRAAGERGVFAMVDHRQAQFLCRPQRGPHEGVVADRRAVITEGDTARGGEGCEAGQRFPGAALADTANGQDPHRGGLPRAAQDKFDDLGPVHRRFGVGHGADGGEASPRRCPGARRDRFLVLESGLAQVRVEVDEPRCDHEAPGIDDRDAGSSYIAADTLDAARAYEHAASVQVDPVGGVQDAPAGDQEVLWHQRSDHHGLALAGGG